MADLDLTFSLDEEVMGKVVNHELFQGGRLTPVTSENRQEMSESDTFCEFYNFPPSQYLEFHTFTTWPSSACTRKYVNKRLLSSEAFAVS